MDNQHRKISGYRELSQTEIDLMNEVKELGPRIETLLAKINTHLIEQTQAATQARLANAASDENELHRIMTAQPARWLAIARTDLQTGLMAATRAIAQPTFF